MSSARNNEHRHRSRFRRWKHGQHRDHRGDCAPRGRHKLHRRIFWWFGITLLIVGAAAAMGASWSGKSRWRRDLQTIERLAEDHFAEVWDQPQKRDAFAKEIALGFDAGIVLRSAKDDRLAAFGHRCSRKRAHVLRIRALRNATATAGTVHLCRRQSKKPLFFGFLFGGFALWIAAGLMSRRLSRPLRRLSETVRKFGAGDLDERVGPMVTRDTTEVGEVGRSFNEMAEKLSGQLRDQKELLAAVSHEVRTPLARMKMLAELAREESADIEVGTKKQLHPLLHDIDHEIDAIDHLVEQLLASARLDFRVTEPVDVALDEVIGAALRQCTLDKALLVDGEPITVKGDRRQLLRLFSNLIDNATKHGKGVERITMSTDDEGFGVMTVYDRGPGFDPAIVERAFESFTRASQKGGGLGLGLSIVARIARAHGGSVRVVQDGEGAGVEVRLPVSESADRPRRA